MSDISKLGLNNQQYNIKDSNAYHIFDPVETDVDSNDYMPFYDNSAFEQKKIPWDSMVNNISDSLVMPYWRIDDETAEYNNHGGPTFMKVNMNNRQINGNIIYDYLYSNSYWLQGSAYIGNNKIVSYYSNGNDSLDGILSCVDISTNTIVWQENLPLRHGNSICYCDADGCLYVSSGYDVIFKLDLSTRAIIASFTVSMGNQGICYDKMNDVFYGMSQEENVIYKFLDKTFSEYETILVENPIPLPSAGYGAMYHNGELVVGGVIFGFGFRDKDPYITGNDIKTGKLVYLEKIPDFLNGYRTTGEVESIMYDFDNERFIVASTSNTSGVKNKNIATYFEAGILRPVFEVLPFRKYYDSNHEKVTVTVLQDNGQNPPQLPQEKLHCISDALNISKIYGVVVDILFDSDNSIDIGDMYVEDSCFSLSPANDNVINIEKVLSNGKIHATFVKCKFNGKTKTSDNNECNVRIPMLSNVTFRSCQFSDYSNTSSVSGHYHLYVSSGCDVTVSTDTIFGTKSPWKISDDSILTIGDKLTEQQMSFPYNFLSTEWTHIGTISVPNGAKWEVRFDNTVNNSYATGIALTSPSVTDPQDASRFYYEAGGGHISGTPTVIVEETRKLWVRRNNTGNETTVMRYKQVSI